MATTTSRLNLYKPADDGSEFIDVATDINQNLDKLDAAIGFVPTTSSTPPGSPFAGMARQDTDTGRTWYRNGANSTWNQLLNSASTFDSNIVLTSGKKVGLGMTPTGANVEITAPNTTAEVVEARVTGDVEPRMSLSWNGIFFGPGNGVIDTGFYRSNPGELAVDGDVVFDNDLEVTGQTTVDDLTVGGTLLLPSGYSGTFEITGELTGTGIGIPNFKKKTVDTENNTGSYINDPEMFFPALANATYLVELYIHYSSWSSADFKTNWTFPSGTTGNKWTLGMAVAATDRANGTMATGVFAYNADISYGGFGDGGWNGALEQMVITTTTAGNVQFQFCKSSTSDGAAPPAKCRSTTMMRYTRIA